MPAALCSPVASSVTSKSAVCCRPQNRPNMTVYRQLWQPHLKVGFSSAERMGATLLPCWKRRIGYALRASFVKTSTVLGMVKYRACSAVPTFFWICTPGYCCQGHHNPGLLYCHARVVQFSSTVPPVTRVRVLTTQFVVPIVEIG